MCVSSIYIWKKHMCRQIAWMDCVTYPTNRLETWTLNTFVNDAVRDAFQGNAVPWRAARGQ